MGEGDLSITEALAKYKKENLHVRSWADYSKELDALTKKVVNYVKRNKIIVDAVVPIERGGNFAGTYLAYKLRVLQMLPVQYKYFFVGKICELKKMMSVPKDTFSKTESPVLLLVEGNHCMGMIANIAAKDLKKQFPKCRIIYAASNMDYNHQDAVEDAEASFHGSLQNDCMELSDKECRKHGIDPKKSILFPWENIEEEWDTIKLRQHKFNRVEKLRKKAKLCESIKLD
jgi:hypoxanthine phosphoribosyltransferase